MKKLYLFMLLLLLVSPFLMAAGGQGVHISGTITAIDDENLTITVGNILVQKTDSTYLYNCVDGVKTEIDFDDLEVGDRVNVTGQYVGDVLYAKKIVVH